MLRRIAPLLLLIGACAHVAPVPAPAVEKPADASPGRLPRTVVPTKYDLAFTIDPAKTAFQGHERIALRISEPVASIELHSRGSFVSEAFLELADGRRLTAEAAPRDADGFLRVSLPETVPAGNAVLELTWTGTYGEQSQGLFRFTDASGSYAFTQFEALFARRTFPCFDEPSFKAPFEVTVTIPAEDEAISNTLPLETTTRGALKTVHFAPTLPLPTYLVMLAVGPLDIVPGPDVPPNAQRAKPLPVRAAAIRGQGGKLKYALAHLGPIVETLEKKLGAFPYPKLDLVAVPGFAAGAMENAGAITFREWLLLMDETHHGVDQARAFEAVAAHELAHQWFGDLVTLAWWDDLWLNESFATWMEAHVVAALDPGAHAEEDALEEAHGAMAADSLASSRRIHQQIASNDDIDNAFDGITYSKGAAVLRMFERWVGEERFFAGIRRYLGQFANGNATAEDFLAAISAEAGRDVAPAFRTFLDQPGVPLVRMRVDGARVTLSQERWLPLAASASREGLWQIPICLKYERNGASGETCTLLADRTATVTLDGAGSAFVFPNAGGAGYFRFALEDAQWAALAKHREALTTREELAAADSLKAAFAAGALEAQPFYASLAPLVGSSERHVAQVPYEALREAREVIVPELAAAVEARSRRLYAAQIAQARLDGPAGESEEMRLRRAELVTFLLEVAREPALREAAKARGEKLVGFGGDGALHPEAVDPTLADAVLATAVEEDGAALVKRLGELLVKGSDADVRRRVLAALGAARGEAGVAARALVLTDAVRGNEMYYLLRRQFGRPETRAAAWDWLVANFDAVVGKYPEEFVGMLPWYGAGFCREEDARAVEAFFRPRLARLPGGPRNLAGTLEAIHLCAAEVARHHAGAAAFFEEK